MKSDPSLATPVAPRYPDVVAQAVLAVAEEHGARLSDFSASRARLGFTMDQGWAAGTRVADVLAQEAGWSPTRRKAEVAAYEACVASTPARREG